MNRPRPAVLVARAAAVVFALAALTWLVVVAQRRAGAEAPAAPPHLAEDPVIGPVEPVAVEPPFLFSSKAGPAIAPPPAPEFLPSSKFLAPDSLHRLGIAPSAPNDPPTPQKQQ